MEPRRRNPLRRYPMAVCIGVWHFGLTQPTRPKDKSVEQPWVFGLCPDWAVAVVAMAGITNKEAAMKRNDSDIAFSPSYTF